MISSKQEYRNLKQYQNKNFQNSKQFWSFKFKILNLFRISSLGLRVYKSNKGFTLVEAIIYIGIIGLILVTMVRFVFTIGDIKNKVYVQQEVQANARIALETISQRVKSANGINIGASTFDTDPGVLSLSTTTVAADPMVFSLSQDDGVLRLTEGVSSPITVTSDEVKVTNLVFTNLSATSTKPHIRVEFTIEYAKAGDVYFEYSQTIQSSISLRQ